MKYLYGTAVMAAVLASTNAEDILANEVMTMLARASSTSEVLTLNLTNLFIILLLKAIIIGVGLFATDGTSSYSRSLQETSLMPTKLEATGALCFMQYMAGDDSRLPCVQRATCEDATEASKIVMASKMLFKAMNVLGLPVSEKYTTVYNAMNDAQTYARAGGNCVVYQWPSY